MSAGPTITSISPGYRTPSGGTTVSIAGSGLSTATDVLFGGISVKANLVTSSDSFDLSSHSCWHNRINGYSHDSYSTAG